jgi:hypothetical protein
MERLFDPPEEERPGEPAERSGDEGAARGSGTLWVATSNRDGRGSPRPGDDRIVAVRVSK